MVSTVEHRAKGSSEIAPKMVDKPCCRDSNPGDLSELGVHSQEGDPC